MPKKDDEFLKKLLATFRVEADEHLKSMSSGLLELEKAPGDARRAELVETIFREAHSLKGAARAVNFSDIESACQSLESLFAGMKSGADIPGQLFDLLHPALDALGGLLSPESAAAAKPALATLIRRLEAAMNGPPSARAEPSSSPTSAEPAELAVAAAAEALPASRGPAPETVRISAAKLDAAMRQAEELLGARLAAGERARELREFQAALATRKKERAEIHTVLRALERSLKRSGKGNGESIGAGERRSLAKLIEQLEAGNVFVKTLEHRLARLAMTAEGDHRALTAVVNNLVDDVKEMQLLPAASLLEALPRMVRELARDRGKQAELAVQGGEIEIDRRILEELKDPLIHLLRNCVDHGVETPAERVQKGKPAHGTISIAISQKDGGKIEVTVADDGAGIDVAKVKAAAAKLGEVSAEEAEQLDEQGALALVFRSGVSTSPIITDLSGRGLGLAIVREKVERLGGTIALETPVDAGTTFRIVLPLTLATFRGILVRAGERLFVIPAVSVERAVRVAVEDIQTLENRETIPLGGQAVSLVRLGDALEMPRKGESADTVHAVVLGSGLARIAFQVDEVLGEQEVLVKSLGPQLARVRNVAGASVLGTGEVAPVLNVPDLMKSAAGLAATTRAPVAAEKPAEARKRSVLVVEDSITSRSLLKNILESAGYGVATAVDGIDAFTALKTATFDLVVSDVEMPRMDGFDLTAKIRADKNLSELPVVLVTALERREHRERGIEAGANAYIVKSSFDQSNLLEVVRRLIS
ncbi:MAG: hybrid sensor histidine kinase/response regulator [Betaproteobacteria bacterium]|nr:MAG: hybrid sensor histidine kinase/response regulator [Betaproteobacteria bacterium]